MKCKDCKHWKHHGLGTVWGECPILKNPTKQNPYLFDYDTETGTPVEEIDTHANFGCVLFKDHLAMETR